MAEMQYAGDMTMVPDPLTFCILPWAPHTASMICDLYFQNGLQVPFSTRGIMKRELDKVANAGFAYCAGLEVEFHLFRVTNPHRTLADSGQPATPPDVEFISHGYNYLTELRYDQLDPVFEILRKHLQAMGLPLRSLEVEFGPGQCEFTFGTQNGIAAADAMVMLRNAVKQIATRHGYHATFMCRPKIPNVFSSGWHLHQSLTHADGSNAFATPRGSGDLLTETAQQFLGGILAHAEATTPFTTPTINGYRRYRTHSLAPDRVAWGAENKAAMVRVCGDPGNPTTHLENRVGEPAANPYLYMASQIVCGLDGIRNGLDPGPSADSPYESTAPMLPTSLEKALDLLESDAFYREAFGARFIDYFIHIKRAEIARFQLDVSEWEQREYFDLF
jgi:glutamine synthetase